MKYVTESITSRILLFYYLGNPASPFLDYIISQNPSFVNGFCESFLIFFNHFERDFCPTVRAISNFFSEARNLILIDEIIANLATAPSSVVIPPSAIFELEVSLGEVAPPHAAVEEVKGLILFTPLCFAWNVIVKNLLCSLFTPHLAVVEFGLDFLYDKNTNPDRKEDYSVDLVAVLAPPLAENFLLGLSVHCFNDFVVHDIYLSL